MEPGPARFLIVDDEPDMCWAFEQILQRQAVACERAQSAGEALRLLQEGSFSMAFVDAKLPDMDGLELARRMRLIAPTTRILMVSGYFYKNDPAIQEAIASGAICGFIGKPFVHEEILKFV